ncbi:MAG: hypothetical protein GY856_43000, partial [bacterium]|nr:hypothetical protein [bacterium]
MNVRSFALRGSLLLLLSLSASVAAVKPRPSVTVEPRPLRMPYLWGIRGDREATITFTNPTDTEILLARGGIEILLGDPAIETVLIATLHPPVEPLLLDPGQSLAWRWKVPGSIAEPVPAVGADHLLTVRGRYAPAAAPAQLDEVTTRLALRAPPAGYRWLRSHLPSLMLQLVLAALGGRFLLALIRITRRPTSRSQREPGTAPEAALLKLLAVVGIAIARPRLSTRARLRLLLPALTFARWQAFSGGPVEARLRLLGRCEQILGDVDPGHLPPVNPVFLLHWETAEALDQRARSQATEWAESAEKIALRYQQAARFSQDRRLRALCWELAEFYQLVRQRFGSRRRPVAAADAPRPDPGAARSVWWASELLRRNLEGGPAAVLETLKLIPADVQNLPILTWAAGSAGSWPPPPAGLRAPVAGPLSKKQQAIRNAERYLRQGEIGRGMIETTKIFNATSSFPTILEQEGGAVACRALLTAARAFAEHHRFLATLPFSGKERRQHLAATFEFIAMMDRVLRKNPPVDDPAAAAMVFGLAGDLAAIQGRYPQALQNLEMIRVFSRFPDRRVLEARAVAERVRGEIYQGCGSTARAGKALAEAADWCALLGDWTRWLETNAYRLRVRLAEFEQGRSTKESVAAASQRLDEMAAAAAMVVAKRGLADLFDAWASWGAYLLARRAQDQVTALAAVLDRVQPSGAKSGWGIPEILLGRILVFRSVRKVVTISLPRAALPSLLGPGYAFWRARRQTHTTLVLGNLHFHLGMVEKGSGAATVFGRKAKKLISTGRLDLPDSIRLQIEAATLLAEWEHSSGRPSKRLANAVDLSIEALNSLTAEIDSAPVGSLRRIASVRSVDVLSQLLRSLDAARSVLDGEELDRVVATAYRALQRLRAQEWEKLLAQKIVGSGSSEPDGRIDQHLRLQRRLVFVRDQLLLQSGRLTAELRAEATRLSRQVPELACELSPESVSRALDRLREELDEMMRRKAEAGAPIAPPPRPAIPGEDHVKVPEGCAVVEYFKTPERACAFVLKGGCDRIRYLPLEVIEIPKLEELSGELVRSVRDLGRLPAPPAPELPAGLARFESALQTIARA